MKNKKVFAVALALASSLFLSSCGVMESYDMTISSKEEVNIKLTVAYDEEMIKAIITSSGSGSDIDVNDIDDISDLDPNKIGGDEMNEDEMWDWLEDNLTGDVDYDYDKFEEDGFYGFTFDLGTVKMKKVTGKKSDDPVNLISENIIEEIEDSPLFIEKNGVYKSNMTFDFKDSEYTKTSDSSVDMDNKITFSVTLPNKPIKHNADEVSKNGKTLTWDLSDMKNNDIEFEFKFFNATPYIIGISACVVILIVAIIIIIVASSSKKKEKKPEAKTTVIEQQKPIAPTVEAAPVTESVPDTDPADKYAPKTEVTETVPEAPAVNPEPLVVPEVNEDLAAKYAPKAEEPAVPEVPATPTCCPNCGYAPAEGAEPLGKFCPECGTKL